MTLLSTYRTRPTTIHHHYSFSQKAAVDRVSVCDLKSCTFIYFRSLFVRVFDNVRYVHCLLLRIEGRKVRSAYLPFQTNASTLPITPRRSSSRDVGTSSYRYHTATYSPASVSANEPYHIRGEHVSSCVTCVRRL
ncbi:hypothetical protein TNCV_4909351 [Trichonephila clavipes]|uniref:Uncharacterized protein n=1 Tax=Trichonephila clavipes TaxID=2585209 RepID=A0A8X6S0F6_TRICX|nr:hypothetical protein TNCV_4909351 [Trichonephila clavipes]